MHDQRRRGPSQPVGVDSLRPGTGLFRCSVPLDPGRNQRNAVLAGDELLVALGGLVGDLVAVHAQQHDVVGAVALEVLREML